MNKIIEFFKKIFGQMSIKKLDAPKEKYQIRIDDIDLNDLTIEQYEYLSKLYDEQIEEENRKIKDLQLKLNELIHEKGA